MAESRNKSRFHVLDGMRGIAAIVVMLFHYSPFLTHAMLQNGYIAVDFFFVLSGFILSHSYENRIQNGMSSYEFISKRIARLYPMLLMGLVVGAPTYYIFVKTGYFTYPLGDILKSILYNIFFLPFIKVGPIFPTNDPLWSLFFEMAASIAFIGLIRLQKHVLINMAKICFLIIIIQEVLFIATHDDMLLNYGFGWGAKNFAAGFARIFYSFICGMLIFQAHNRVEPSTRNNPFFVYFCLLCVLFFPFRAQGIYYLCAIGCMTPALVKMGAQTKLIKQSHIWFADFLGNISYPLYCLHFPVRQAFIMLQEYYHIDGSLCYVSAITVSLTLSIFAAKYYETPFRHFLTKQFASIKAR